MIETQIDRNETDPLITAFQRSAVLDQEDDSRFLEYRQESITVVTRELLGKTVLVTTIDKETKPITAYFHETPLSSRREAGYKPYHGLVFRRHPAKVIGTVEEVNSLGASIKLTPRFWSIYNLDDSFYSVDVMGDDYQPLVKIERLDQEAITDNMDVGSLMRVILALKGHKISNR